MVAVFRLTKVMTMFDLSSWATMLQEYQHAIGSIAAVSALIFAGSILLVPWLVVRIPEDYFATARRPKTLFADEHPLLRWTGLILKNFLGVVLMLAGIAMLLLPGQGLLTIAIGLLLLDFPGKHNLERQIVRMSPVLKSINWLRRRAKVPPLVLTNDSWRGS